MAQPLLARGVVRFVGEPVAVVLTEDRLQGEDAAELVAVDYEPLPAVVDPREALTDEVLLFPEHGTNTALASPEPRPGTTPGTRTSPRVRARPTSCRQETPDTFAGCEVVVSEEVGNQRVAVAPLEVRAAAATWGGRPADPLDAEPGRAGQQASGAPDAGPEAAGCG